MRTHCTAACPRPSTASPLPKERRGADLDPCGGLAQTHLNYVSNSGAHTSFPTKDQAADTIQTHFSELDIPPERRREFPYHSNQCISQPFRWSALPLRVATTCLPACLPARASQPSYAEFMPYIHPHKGNVTMAALTGTSSLQPHQLQRTRAQSAETIPVGDSSTYWLFGWVAHGGLDTCYISPAPPQMMTSRRPYYTQTPCARGFSAPRREKQEHTEDWGKERGSM